MSDAKLEFEGDVRRLEEELDSEIRFRPLLPAAGVIVTSLLIALSCFHYYTAGFGLLRETTHRGVHLAFVLGLIFLVFAGSRAAMARQPVSGWTSPGGIPLLDWILVIAVAVSVLYIPYVFEDLAFRVGNPGTLDVVFGTILIVAGLEFFPVVALGPVVEHFQMLAGKTF